MARILTVGAAQLGPIARDEPRASVVERMIALLALADEKGCQLVVYPELALTTFFPRWYMEEQEEVDAFFESSMPNGDTARLFDEAKRRGIGFNLGYAELAKEKTDVKEGEGEPGRVRRFNTAILVDPSGDIVGKYRKVHLPGHAEHEPKRPFQHLEKRYFEVGDLGFPVFRAFGGIMGMCICNDRRWPETYRVMGLRGVELVLLGYNTPSVNSQRSSEGPEKRLFHNDLVLRAGAYQNSTWVVAVAKAGAEDGFPMIGGSAIVNPEGEIVVRAKTERDELIVNACDLDDCNFGKETIFDFARHRRIEHYGLITEQTGVVRPKE